MDSILKYLKSPDFIIGVLVGGTVIAIFGGICTHWLINKFPPKFKNLVTNFSIKWKTRTNELRQKRENRIIALMNNPPEQLVLLSLASAKRVSLIAVGFMLIIFAIIAVTYLQFLLNSIDDHKSAWEIIKLAVVLVFSGCISLIGLFAFTSELEDVNTMVQDVIEARKRDGKRVN